MISKENSNETTVRSKGPVANKPFGQFVKQAVPEDFFDELTFALDHGAYLLASASYWISFLLASEF